MTARQDANRIADGLEALATTYETLDAGLATLAPLVREFISGQRWVELGYDSLAECRSAEFPALARIASTTAARVAFVNALGVLESPQGAVLSTRALAEAVGVTEIQLRRDVAVVREVRSGKPTEGLDGKVRMPKAKAPQAEPTPGEWRRIGQLRSVANLLTGWRDDFAKPTAEERWEAIRALDALIGNAEALVAALDVDAELEITHYQHAYREGQE